MIQVSGISKNFGDVAALSDVSFPSSKARSSVSSALMGLATTTMDIICGCLGPDSGSVTIGEYDITEDPVEAKARIRYLPDEPPIHHDMKVREFVEYPPKLEKFLQQR